MTLRSRVYDIAKVTPYELMPGLSERVEATCFAKREDIQPGFSNNLRGVYNRMFNLSEAITPRPDRCFGQKADVTFFEPDPAANTKTAPVCFA